MRDYVELVKDLRCHAGTCEYKEAECSRYNKRFDDTDYTTCSEELCDDAADAIEELLAFAKFVARQAIGTGDNDGVSAEILCRKLNKLGLIETDGEFWTLPEPPKGVE